MSKSNKAQTYDLDDSSSTNGTGASGHDNDNDNGQEIENIFEFEQNMGESQSLFNPYYPSFDWRATKDNKQTNTAATYQFNNSQ